MEQVRSEPRIRSEGRSGRASARAPTLAPVERRGSKARAPRPRAEPFGKRALDLVLGLAMVVATAPLWGLVAVAIKLDDGGPVFYRQKRHGKDGKKIEILKFRTMIPDSDREYGILQASEGDERITRVGRWLRRFGLDELPQIVAIVKGDMSFVGPRPLAVGEIVRDDEGRGIPWEWLPGFQERLRVRPGLTSLATIYLPKDVAPSRKFRYDLIYVRKRSLGLDLRLVALSFWISFVGRWETRSSKV